MAEAPLGRSPGISLQAALLTLVAAAFLAGILPAGATLHRWVAGELESRVRADLELAPRVLADRNAAIGDAMMMHAKELAHVPNLGPAIASRDRQTAVELADAVARSYNSLAVVVGADGESWAGPRPPLAAVEATRRGEMPIVVVSDGGALYRISIVPVEYDGAWIGAAGVATPLDEATGEALAGLTRSDLVIVLADDGTHAAAPAGVPGAEAILGAAMGPRVEAATRAGVQELATGDRHYLYNVAPIGGGTVVFARDLQREQALLATLRQAFTITGAGALALTLLLGTVLARGIARPVRVLAAAAGRLSRGDFDAPLTHSPVREVARVTTTFGEMRTALAIRIEELRTANRMLEERQARLRMLQAELIHRERVAVSGRIVAELAHEIRNPVANLRNCLELLHRRLRQDPEGQEYAAFAIDELLRMHELAERMLHLNRPRSSVSGGCDATEVANEVATLSRIGVDTADVSVTVRGSGQTLAAIPADALKQVLINLVQNARDALPVGLELTLTVAREHESVILTVCDNGPGIPADIRGRIFDPFFTTRTMAGGVGLGLFVVEGVVSGHGGTVSVGDAPGGGACFRIAVPAASAPVAQEKDQTPSLGVVA